MQKSADQLIELIESYENGNLSHYWQQVRKLSRKDRSRLVSLVRCNIGYVTALEHARKIIEGEF